MSREGSLADLVDGITTGADVYESYVKSSVLLARELARRPGKHRALRSAFRTIVEQGAGLMTLLSF